MTNTSQELQLLSTNILNWIKYQNENHLIARETFVVHEMISQVARQLSTMAKQKGVAQANKLPKSLSVYQHYEPLKILVYNRIANSIQFTERGTIAVDAGPGEQSMWVSVTDEGVGMSAEQIQRILAEQVVITSANVDNKKGHGLGYLIIQCSATMWLP